MTGMFLKGMSGLLAALSVVSSPLAIYTGGHYTYDDWGKPAPAPESYRAAAVLDGIACGAGAFAGPEDLFVGPESVYVADTGNDRVVVLDRSLRFRRSIESVRLDGAASPLKGPKGVFEDADGSLYICDTGNNRVLRIDETGRVLRQFTRPQTALLAEDVPYQPEKVAVDSGGAVYVVAYGVYQGLIEYDAAGAFTGFFGSNRVELTLDVLATYFWKQLLSKEQGESLTRLIPTQYANIFIDAKDFLYTATSETQTSTDEVKKLNAMGVNVLRSPAGQLYDHSDFADLEKDQEKGQEIDSQVVDVHVDDQGIISLLDARRGRVFQYNQDCRLLFTFGNLGDQKGTFKRPAALSKRGDEYLVLDADRGTVTVFAMTDYARDLREAVAYYDRGEYQESMALWQALLQQNSHLSLAYQSIGKALLQQQQYAQAMTYFERGNDREGYSDALREYRKTFIRANALWLALLLAAAVGGLYVLVRLVRRRLGFARPRRRRHIE